MPKSMKFNAQLGYVVPGNFVGWQIRPLSGIKTPKIPDDYTLEGVEQVLVSQNITISQSNPFAMPHVGGGDALKSAVFEFEKMGRSTFRLLRYVGELKVLRTIVLSNGGVEEIQDIPQTAQKAGVNASPKRRWADLDV